MVKIGHYPVMYKDCLPSLIRIGYSSQNFVAVTGFHYTGIVSIYIGVIILLPTTGRVHC